MTNHAESHPNSLWGGGGRQMPSRLSDSFPCNGLVDCACIGTGRDPSARGAKQYPTGLDTGGICPGKAA